MILQFNIEKEIVASMSSTGHLSTDDYDGRPLPIFHVVVLVGDYSGACVYHGGTFVYIGLNNKMLISPVSGINVSHTQLRVITAYQSLSHPRLRDDLRLARALP
jgi:hypothetical protein